MRFLATLICLIFISNFVTAQKEPEATEVWEPEPRIVTPGEGTAPPSDAIILFDGSDLDQWQSVNGKAKAQWTINDGVITVKPGTGDIMTRNEFGDVQLHIEWRSPEKVENDGQNRGNSGVFLQLRYEVQVLDNYGNRTYSNGQAASIYKQSIPLVNACKKPGEWQTYDIIYTTPKFNKDGIKIASAYITVLQNGILVQNHVEIKGTTEYIGQPKNIAHGKAAIKLQDHSCTVSYRNIWLREL